MKNTTSHTRRLLLSKNFILMVVMLVVIIVAISAWFTVNKTVTANNIMVQAQSTEIDIAKCVKTYDSNHDVVTDGPGVFDNILEFNDIPALTKDCTGDGTVKPTANNGYIPNLIVPEFNVTKDYESVRTHSGKEVNENIKAADAVSDVDSATAKLKNPDAEAMEYQYIKREFYVRSKKSELRLSDNCQLLAKTEDDGGSLAITLNTGNSKKSAYGNFNVDGLVGAVRVALIGEACSQVNQTWQNNKLTATSATRLVPPVKQFLWNPRPDVKLNVNPSEGNITDWTLSTGVAAGDTYKHTFYERNSANNGVELVTIDPLHDNPVKDPKAAVSTGTYNNIKSLGQTNINISEFSNFSPTSVIVDGSNPSVTENYYVTKYTLLVWLEGTDSEARRAMDGGEFKLKLYFT